MSSKYKTVTVFESVVTAINESRLSDAEKGRFYSAYMEYFLHGTEPVLKGHGRIIFELVRPSLDVYVNRRKNNENYYHNKAQEKKEFSTESRLNKNLKQCDFSTENDTENDTENESRARIVRVKVKKEDTIVSKKKAASGDDNDDEKKSVVSDENRELQIVENLAAAYPKKFGLIAGKRAALKVIRSEFDKGNDYDRIELDLTDDVKAYAETVAQWPEEQKRYIWAMETFFSDGHYLDDRETWIRSNDENDNETPDVFRRLDERK